MAAISKRRICQQYSLGNRNYGAEANRAALNIAHSSRTNHELKRRSECGFQVAFWFSAGGVAV